MRREIMLGAILSAAALATLAALGGACGYPAPPLVGDAAGSGGSAGGSGGASLPTCPTCALFAVTPAIANTGDTITLDGVFEAGATVHTSPAAPASPRRSSARTARPSSCLRPRPPAR